jgi:hypothetical protein
LQHIEHIQNVPDLIPAATAAANSSRSHISQHTSPCQDTAIRGVEGSKLHSCMGQVYGAWLAANGISHPQQEWQQPKNSRNHSRQLQLATSNLSTI